MPQGPETASKQVCSWRLCPAHADYLSASSGLCLGSHEAFCGRQRFMRLHPMLCLDDLAATVSHRDCLSHAQAVEKFQKALGLDPKKHDALWCLGNAYTSQVSLPSLLTPLKGIIVSHTNFKETIPPTWLAATASDLAWRNS